MTRQFITTGSIYEKMAGYSRAVADGRWVFVSGTVGADFSTGQFARGIEAQTHKALDTIEWALTQAAAKMTDVVRVRVIVPNPADVMAVSKIIAERLGAAKPANTTICSPLAVPEALVEIEVTASKAE